MKNKLLLLLLAMLLMLASCNTVPEYSGDISHIKPVKIAVISDIHYMAPSLLANDAENGEAFLNYINADPKLVQFSDPIFKEALSKLSEDKPDILLISGDLTKDGELASHQAFIQLLQPLKNAGTKIYVIPGNHDINNPEARRYDGNSESVAATIPPAQFATMYGDFGYNKAIARDANSLSYVAEPFADLWILAIDDCKYNENTGGIAVISGNIKSQTMQWIKDQMASAEKKGVRVIGLMHHNLIEHYAGQTQLDPGYVTDNYESNANALMDAGLDVIFTGHYHANDITTREYNGNTLYDIETGSLTMAPIPYRLVTMKTRSLEITTKHITSIGAQLPGGMDLEQYSNVFLSAHLDGVFSYLLTQPPFSASEEEAAMAAPLFRNAYMAHLAGDENISPEEQSMDDALAEMSPVAGMALAALWTDLNPADNKLQINLRVKK